MVRQSRPYPISDTILDPRMYRVFKRVFGAPNNKDILIGFLNDILVKNLEYPIKDVVTLGNEYAPGHFHEKSISIDVLCEDTNGE